MRPFLFLVALSVVVPVLSGCIGDDDGQSKTDLAPASTNLKRVEGSRQQIIASSGSGVEITIAGAAGEIPEILGTLHKVGQRGPEPSIGVTSKGGIFFQALEKTMRSTDHGVSFKQVSGPLTATTTSDPYLWVDPATDRIFQVNMVSLVCSHIAWSDDEGETWLGNPMDCGPVPVNDHIKLATGPWAGGLAPLGQNPAYPNAVYYAYNKLVLGGWMAVSLDGGATFPIARQMFPSGCNGALHGNIATAPDGAVYVPARYCPGPLVAYSHDNGLTWNNVVVGADVGVPAQQKNPDIAVDSANNVYMAWVGKDNRTHLAVSKDRGDSWSKPVVVTPPQVGSSVWPAMVAGDAGRIGVAYIGTEDSSKGPWEVENETEWHLYYTYGLNALDANPTFVTVQMTANDDPVQKGTICVSSGACRNGNRNLLDFIDMSLDSEGRPYIAYADGCTSDACLSPKGKPTDSRSRDGMVAILQKGPSLFTKAGLLDALK